MIIINNTHNIITILIYFYTWLRCSYRRYTVEHTFASRNNNHPDPRAENFASSTVFIHTYYICLRRPRPERQLISYTRFLVLYNNNKYYIFLYRVVRYYYARNTGITVKKGEKRKNTTNTRDRRCQRRVRNMFDRVFYNINTRPVRITYGEKKKRNCIYHNGYNNVPLFVYRWTESKFT